MLFKTLALVLATCFLVRISFGEKPPMPEIKAKCREENHLAIEEVEYLNKTRTSEIKDERVKCYIKCILNGLNLMNLEGDLTLEDEPVRNGKFKKHLPACKDVTGSDPCDKAANFHNCLWKQVEKEEKTVV